MKIYRGVRLDPIEKTLSEVLVLISKEDGTTYELKPDDSQKIYNHSPTGFSWGYNGAGPAQLALAIVYDHLNDQSKAVQYYQRFKTFVVAGWGEQWTITSEQIQTWINNFAQNDS